MVAERLLQDRVADRMDVGGRANRLPLQGQLLPPGLADGQGRVDLADGLATRHQRQRDGQSVVELAEEPFDVPERRADEIERKPAMQPQDFVVNAGAVDQVWSRRERCRVIGRDASFTRADPVHPRALLPVDPVVIRRASDDVHLVARGGKRLGQVAGVAANAAEIVGRILVADEAERQPAALGPDGREGLEPRSVGRGDRGESAAAGPAEFEPPLLALGDPLHEVVELLLRHQPIPQRSGRVAGHARGVLDEVGVDGVPGVAVAAMQEGEVPGVLHVRVRLEHDPPRGAEVRREILVVDGAVGSRHEEPADVIDPRRHIGLVVEVLDLLVEATDLREHVAAEGGVGALQVDKPLGAGRDRAIVGLLTREVCAAEPVAEREAVLVPDASVIPDDATHAGDPWIGIRFGELFEPVGLGNRVIVDERDDVARGSGDADVAAHRDVDLGAATDHAGIAIRLEQFGRAVGRWPIHDDDLEVAVPLMAEGREGPREARRAVVGVDDDADSHRSDRGVSGGYGGVGHVPGAGTPRQRQQRPVMPPAVAPDCRRPHHGGGGYAPARRSIRRPPHRTRSPSSNCSVQTGLAMRSPQSMKPPSRTAWSMPRFVWA